MGTKERRIRVRRGKGRTGRVVALDLDFYKRLKVYIAKYHREGSPRLFISLPSSACWWLARVRAGRS